MKKFTIIMIALLVASMSFAQTKQLDKEPIFRACKNVATLTHTRAVTGTLQLCGTMGDNSIGTGSAATLDAAARFEASDLTAYVGQYITKITVGIGNGENMSGGKVAVLTGTVAAPVIATQQACTFTAGMNEITLAVPYQIPAETAIMIAYEVTVTGGYPLGCDAGPVVTGGNLIAMGGLTEEYSPLSDINSNLTYNFIIAATVEDEVSSDPVMIAGPSELSFIEEVNNNSEAQIVSISAANLTSNITASVTGPFEISADNTTFGTTANFTSDGGSLYVRFSPTAAGNATGTITISSTGVDNATIALSGYAYDCGTAITAPWTETFEANSTTIYCWSGMSNNTENMSGSHAFGFYNMNGGTVFRFSSYNSASDYNQYLITPELNLTEDVILSFGYACYSSYGTEQFRIMTSTTDSNIDSFTAFGDDVSTTETSFTTYTATIPAGTKYIAINYFSDFQYDLYIDNVSIIVVPTAAEIALTSVTPASGLSIALGEDLTISGVITNNGVDLTSYKVSYTVDGGAAVDYDVTGINVGTSLTHNFTHPTPISGLTAGSHTIVVTVSNPNGAADNTSDNSQTITINVMDCSAAITTFPYEEGFESGVPACWTLIDADGDGYNWMGVSENPIFGSNAANYAHGGSNAVMSESYRNQVGAFNADNWMITNAFTIPLTGEYTASWYALNFDDSDQDTYTVHVGTEPTVDGMGNAVLSHTPNTDWELKTISLSEYAGQTIYIGFHHVDNNMYVIMIDDFSIALNTSVNENIADAIAVYPNPTKDMVTVANAEGKNIVIVNSLGQVVANIENAAANQTIDVANFANGTYFVKVDAEVVKLNVVK